MFFGERRLSALMLFVVLVACGPVIAQSIVTEEVSSTAPISLATIHQQPFFFEVMMASIIGWIVGITKGFSTSRSWFTTYLKDAPVLAIFGLDLLIFVVVGAYVGTGVYQPSNFVAALGAGITWPLALGTLASKPSPIGGDESDV